MKIPFRCMAIVLALAFSGPSAADVSAPTIDKNTLTYSFPDVDWFPLYYSKQGKVCGSAGVFLEILDSIFAKHSDLQFNCTNFPWKRAQLSVEKGLSDFLITVPTQKRLEYAKSSKHPVFQLYLHVYTYKGHSKINEIRKIKSVEDILRLGLVAVTNRGNGWHKTNIEEAGVKTHEVSDDDILPKFLARQRADIMIDAVIPMNYKINQLGFASDIVLTQAKFGPIDFHLLMSKKSKHIGDFPRLDDTISQLKREGAFDEIQGRYSKLDN